MHPNLFCVPQLRSQMRIHAWPNGGCRWRRRGSLTTSLCGSEWVCVCVCVCVRQTWGGVKPESTISPSQVFHTRCLHILLCQLCVHCALLCCTTPTDDLEIWRDRAARHEIPKHWWNVPLLGFYKTLIYLFIKKKIIPCAFCCTTRIRMSVFLGCLITFLFATLKSGITSVHQ